MRTPARCHFSTISRRQSVANHSRSAVTMVGPTPSACASSSSDAAMIRGSEPNSSASARAAVGPTCRIDSATMTFHSGRCLTTSRFANSFCPLADSAPALVRNSSTSVSFSSSRSNRSPSSASAPESISAAAAS